MKKIIIFVLFIFAAYLLGSVLVNSKAASAQEIPVKAPKIKEVKLKYPIKELGSCKDLAFCRSYCDDPLHSTECIKFAKKKGFFQEDSVGMLRKKNKGLSPTPTRPIFITSAPTAIPTSTPTITKAPQVTLTPTPTSVVSATPTIRPTNTPTPTIGPTLTPTPTPTLQELEEQADEILGEAQQSLGCSTLAECQDLCSKPENFDKCTEFAENNNVTGGTIQDPDVPEIIDQAGEVLGCTSAQTCVDFCSKEENKAKCTEFAQDTGLLGGETPAGPGGCTSEETCNEFCKDPNNFSICSGFASSQGDNFLGPGECNSPATCRIYCEQNPSQCNDLSQLESFDKEGVCRQTPSCTWNGTDCTCEEAQVPYKPTGPYDPYKSCTKFLGCRYTNNQCSCPEPGALEDLSPEAICAYYECTYDGNSCNCGSSRYQTPQQICQRTGCSWTGTSCSCRGVKTFSPKTTVTP